MALLPKICIKYEADATKITVKGNTGAYTVNNIGGLGSPNLSRNNLAAVLIAYYHPYETAKTLLTDLSSKYVDFNATYTDSDEPTFNVSYKKDGWYSFIYIFVPTLASGFVSNVAGNVVYNTTTEVLEKYTSATTREVVTNPEDLIKPELYALTEVDDMCTAKLNQKYNELGRNFYACQQCVDCGCDEEFEELVKLREGISVAKGHFNISKLEAQNIVERLTRQYQIR